MKRLTDNRWFALADLAGAALAAALVSVWPRNAANEWSGWPILIALVPWALRVLAGRFLFKRTFADVLLLVFVLTAAMGVWAAYDRTAAWQKFWNLVSGVVLYYAVAGQPAANRSAVIAGLCSAGVAVTGYFLLTTNWYQQLSDLAFVNRLVEALTGSRPGEDVQFLNTDALAGMLAALAPLGVAAGLHAWQQRRRLELGWVVLTGVVMGVGLLISSSRAAWLAIAAGLGLWALWAGCAWIARRRGWRPLAAFAAVILTLAILALGIGTFYPGGLTGLADHLPGPKVGGSRFALFGQALNLIRDFPLTGSGLASFAGLYSRYELVVPYFVFDSSHNFLLDVTLEQGVLGLLALAAVYSGNAWQLIRLRPAPPTADSSAEPWRWAILSALVITSLHGLMDSALYGGPGSPLVFLVPGLATMLTATRSSENQRQWLMFQGLGLLVATAVLAGFAFFGRAAVYANLGAVEMARRELASWPDRNWQDNQDSHQFTQAQAMLEQALSIDPLNHTARYRLGLLWLMEDEVETAVGYFQTPHPASAVPRGLAKNLGYGYTWLGRIEEGVNLLRAIPEAQYEMDLYAQWWPTVGYAERGLYATQMARRLEELGLPYTGNPLAKIP